MDKDLKKALIGILLFSIIVLFNTFDGVFYYIDKYEKIDEKATRGIFYKDTVNLNNCKLVEVSEGVLVDSEIYSCGKLTYKVYIK